MTLGARGAKLAGRQRGSGIPRRRGSWQATWSGAAVIVGDLNAERLAHARSFGCETVDPLAGPLPDQIAQILGVPEVDAAVDCVGFEAKGHTAKVHTKDGQQEAPATVLNAAMEITRAGGGDRHPRVVRDRGSWGQRSRRPGWIIVAAIWLGLGEMISRSSSSTPLSPGQQADFLAAQDPRPAPRQHQRRARRVFQRHRGSRHIPTRGTASS